ncbi:MAG TPA: family 20 glycosylhydrolase, partial [Verrucomicrobiae bacterium]|nr:family 20 glycosylhydrolase [Verrucomicrobiae bacterium]
RANAKKLAAIARANHVRLIPELDCLGHQAVQHFTLALLAVHPEFTEPSPAHPDLKTDYLKNWCPNDPRIEPIIFDLIDEIAEAFDADAFHVGMDEIFNLASDKCPRCRGEDPAKLLAKVVNDLHAHIVDTNKLEMFMWGDRLLDSKKMGYSRWESSQIGMAAAIDMIPTNIVICDWHYAQRATYPSVPLFLQKGFRVWPAGFRPVEAAKALSDYSQKMRAKNPRVVGYLATTWSMGKPETVAEWPPVKQILQDWKPVEVVTTNSAPR